MQESKNRRLKNAHFVLNSGFSGIARSIFYNDVQITVVPRIRRAREVAGDGVSLRDCHCCWGVEYRLPGTRNE